jgi:hypothetical protein
MKKVVIIGGGVAGLLTAWVFRERGVFPVVVEADRPGGQFAEGGAKWFAKTKKVVDLLEALDIPFSEFAPRGGVLLQGHVRKYPQGLEALGMDRALNVQRQIWEKTRRVAPPRWKKRVLSDSIRKRVKVSVRCYHPEIIRTLARETEFAWGEFAKAEPGKVHLVGGKTLDWDFLVFTIPTWDIAGKVWFDIAPAFATRLTLAFVSPLKDPFIPWDFIYTPFTPGNFVHRMVPFEDGWVVEATGGPDPIRLESDLGFLFPDGFYIRWVKSDIKGHVVTSGERTKWPKEVAPVGRFAQGVDELRTSDILDVAVNLVDRWVRGPCDA